MTKDNSYTPSCVDCGTQNCKFKDRTYPEFCLTTGLDTEDLEWALERYDEGQNHDVMVASAEVEFEGYCRLTRVEEIMTFARKMGYKKIGIAYVSTAKPLTDEQKKAVAGKLLETTEYVDFQMNYTVDESLIGGMVIRIGDRVVDSSIKHKIDELSRSLMKVQL